MAPNEARERAAGIRGSVAREQAPRMRTENGTERNHDISKVSRRSTNSSSTVGRQGYPSAIDCKAPIQRSNPPALRWMTSSGLSLWQKREK